MIGDEQMQKLCDRRMPKTPIIALVILLLLTPGEIALAAREGNWNPGGLNLHGHTDIHFPVYQGGPYHYGASTA